MRNLFKLRAVLPAAITLGAISAVWMITSAPPASSRPALRGTTLAELDQPSPLARETSPAEPVAAKAKGGGSQQFAVICEAGCGSARDAPAAVCIGGCYNGSTSAVAAIAEAAPEVHAPASIVKRPSLRRGEDQPTSSTTKRWYDRLDDQVAR